MGNPPGDEDPSEVPSEPAVLSAGRTKRIRKYGAGHGIRTRDIQLGKTKMCRERSLRLVSGRNDIQRLPLRGVA
jgi:hypothetical protein